MGVADCADAAADLQDFWATDFRDFFASKVTGSTWAARLNFFLNGGVAGLLKLGRERALAIM